MENRMETEHIEHLGVVLQNLSRFAEICPLRLGTMYLFTRTQKVLESLSRFPEILLAANS